MVLIGEGSNVFYAEEEDGHEECCEGCGAVLEGGGCVLDVML